MTLDPPGNASLGLLNSSSGWTLLAISVSYNCEYTLAQTKLDRSNALTLARFLPGQQAILYSPHLAARQSVVHITDLLHPSREYHFPFKSVPSHVEYHQRHFQTCLQFNIPRIRKWQKHQFLTSIIHSILQERIQHHLILLLLLYPCKLFCRVPIIFMCSILLENRINQTEMDLQSKVHKYHWTDTECCIILHHNLNDFQW